MIFKVALEVCLTFLKAVWVRFRYFQENDPKMLQSHFTETAIPSQYIRKFLWLQSNLGIAEDREGKGVYFSKVIL